MGTESFTDGPLDNVRRTVSAAGDRRFQYEASTGRLSRVTKVASVSRMDYT